MFEYEINPEKVKEADVVVGIASYNEADSIDFPTRQADLGLLKYFSGEKCVIMNCDNHSPDNTKDVFLNTETQTPKIYITTPPDTPGKGYNFENMFRKCHELGAKAIVCVDADLLSITPEWIEYLAGPVMKGFDYVTPVYSRHKYDGTITNNICFPLVYGLLCMNIRQPIGGDFALSGRFADHAILRAWHRTTEQYGIDIFLSMNAILGGFKVAQTGLGSKVHKPSAPKLGPMFLQVVGTAFLTILNNISMWKGRLSVSETEMFGLRELEKPQELDMDREAVRNNAATGYSEQREAIADVLKKETAAALDEVFARDEINLTEELWVRTVYEFMAASSRLENNEALIEAMRPLYFGRTFSFMNDTWRMSTAEAEELILKQARSFFSMRNYLLELIER